MKNSYEIRARKFLDAILPYIEWCKDSDDYELGVTMFNRDTGRKVLCYHGATRIALITSDYVIKFDYSEAVDEWGGCKEEANCYEEAIAEDVSAAFCPIKYLCDRYYVMPKAVCSYSDNNLRRFWRELSLKEEMFISDCVKDIHRGNIGRYNGRMVLIDYACNKFGY